MCCTAIYGRICRGGGGGGGGCMGCFKVTRSPNIGSLARATIQAKQTEMHHEYTFFTTPSLTYATKRPKPSCHLPCCWDLTRDVLAVKSLLLEQQLREKPPVVRNHPQRRMRRQCLAVNEKRFRQFLKAATESGKWANSTICGSEVPIFLGSHKFRSRLFIHMGWFRGR